MVHGAICQAEVGSAGCVEERAGTASGPVAMADLLPHLRDVAVDQVEIRPGLLAVRGHACRLQVTCPGCGCGTRRVHSRYERRIADVNVGERRVVIRLRVRRFFCAELHCPVATFAEQVEGLTSRYARRSVQLTKALASIAGQLAGRAGARLARLLGLLVSRSSLLRLLRSMASAVIGPVRVLGVDDFAFRRGHRYGTILIDMDTHRPIDVLADREADTLAAWLRAHPEVQVICRDRSGAYAEAARQGAPQAIQVADRWHLWDNLADYAHKTVGAHYRCLGRPMPPPVIDDTQKGDCAQVAEATARARTENSALAKRTRHRYEQVQALKAQGKPITQIATELGLADQTVRRFYQAASIDQLPATPRAARYTMLDDFKPYLHQRINDGCTNAQQLYRDILQQGYRGSYGTVRAYLAPLRTLHNRPPPPPKPPTARQITNWILRRPDTLNDHQKLQLNQALADCPHLAALHRHITTFATMLTGRHGHQLDTWIAAVNDDDLPHLHSFTTGIRHDYHAVKAGLTLQYSSGPVEGTINKIKKIKRTLYGRASFDLLRKLILLT